MARSDVAAHDVLVLRTCLRDPITQIFEAAQCLQKAVSAHLKGNSDLAGELIRRADMSAIRDWSESLWGKDKKHRKVRKIENAPPSIPREKRIGGRMPPTAIKKALIERDGYHCRFCGIPVIREAVRRRIRAVYPDALRWGGTNPTQHFAFQAMWLQYDHLVPHARGGDHSVENMVVTCGPCNFGRMEYLLEEVGLADSRSREPIRSTWDGLERFLVGKPAQRLPTSLPITKSLSSADKAEAFFAATPPLIAAFFRRALDLGQKQGLEIRFRGKGFNIRARGGVPFFYCHPPGSLHKEALIEIFLKGVGDAQRIAKMRETFSRIPSLKVSGKHSFRLPVVAETLLSADQTLDAAIAFMQPALPERTTLKPFEMPTET